MDALFNNAIGNLHLFWIYFSFLNSFKLLYVFCVTDDIVFCSNCFAQICSILPT